MSYAGIQEKIDRGELVILDGAIGTEILRRNVSWADHQIGQRPDLVRSIHEDYIRAGADVISTNSFQLCRRAIESHFRDADHRHHIGPRDIDERPRKLLAESVHLAREARDQVAAGRPVAVAGAITTLEWCFRPDLAPAPNSAREEYAEILEVVKEAGADLALLETVNSVTEARVAAEEARRIGLPMWVGFVCDESGALFTGETLAAAAAALEPLGVAAILLNCAPPDDIAAGLERLLPNTELPVGAYPHIGRFNPPEWLFTDEYPPGRYREVLAGWRKRGVRILGGCCGTTPDHIGAIASLP